MATALTGIQPTGDVHLGNYLGAIRPALELQRSYRGFYFIADWHALTTIGDPDFLRASIRQVAATFLALGFDVERHVLWRQSDVRAVAELTWLLGCQITPGLLDRGHATKAAKDAGKEINVGTWLYPLLMSADILAFDTDVVPIGKDQKQHLEIARDIAIKVNHRYGEGTLVVPAPLIREEVAVILGLDGRKMSKSLGNAIPLWAPTKTLRKLIMSIKTDSKGVDEPKDPDTDNVFSLYKHFASAEQVADLRARYLRPGLGYGHAKQELYERVEATLAEPRARYEEWMAHPERLEEVLAAGAVRARVAAETTLDRFRERAGLK